MKKNVKKINILVLSIALGIICMTVGATIAIFKVDFQGDVEQTITANRGSGFLQPFVVEEEEEFVVHNGTSQSETQRRLLLGVTVGQLFAVDTVAVHVLIIVIDVAGALQRISTRLRYGIDAARHEVRLASL